MWDFPGKNTSMACHFLLQGIFLMQGSNLSLFMSPSLAGWFYSTGTTWKHSKIYEGKFIVVIQFLSHVQLCNPMNWSMLGFPVLGGEHTMNIEVENIMYT